jgi:histidine phosphotransfer protein HptB
MIDWDRVESLRDEVGAESFDEVVALFLDEVDAVVDRFRAGLAPDRVERDLHFLKGGALNLGFASLGDLCQAGERLAAEGRPEAVDLGAVIRLYDESRRAFLAGLGRLAA